MLPNYQTYFDEIQIALKEIKRKEHTSSYCKRVIRFLEEHKTKINDWLRYYDFLTEEEEINFFKFIKPQLTSKIIYYKIRQDIYLKLPKSQKSLYKYYNKLLEKNNQIPNNLKSFCRYIRNESTHRDQEYFLRRNNVSDVDDQYHFIFLDERTSTKMELALAFLIAKDQIIVYLENKLQEIEQRSNSQIPNSKLKWTGTKVELIELIYALHHQKVINSGNADIKEVSSGIEKVFNIELSPYLYRIYQDIKRRKTGHTKFLNSLSDNLKTCIFNEES